MKKSIYIFFLLIFKVLICKTKKRNDSPLTARDLLNTIAPTYKQAQLPPGFPPLDTIKTDKFDYGTSDSKVRVTATLENPVTMFPGFISISNVNLNFTFDKNNEKNQTWVAKVKGKLAIGSTILNVNITPNGELTAKKNSIELHDICLQFLKDQANTHKNVGIEVSAISLSNMTFSGKILNNINGVELIFSGDLKLPGLPPIPVKINVNKYRGSKVQLYAVLEFRDLKPDVVLKKILNQRTLNIPFLAHLLSESEIFTSKKDYFGFTFAFNEIYYYKDTTLSSDIITSVLQSHIPEGISILFPIAISRKNKTYSTDIVKFAFVVNQLAFDLLIDQNDKIGVKEILTILSKEFTTDNIPKFVSSLDNAYTSHVSFDANSNTFSIFVRLREYVDLIPNLLRIKITNLVLQRKVGEDNKKSKWKTSAKGVYKIGKTRIYVQYSGLTEEKNKPYGLTGYASKLNLQDIIHEYDPSFYPDEMSEKMIDNTEIENLTINSLRLFSRVPRENGTAHILITGFTTLPAWEKDIQVALLLLYNNDEWKIKWAASFKMSPLSNIIQALTGFDARDIRLLHNNHIMTTIISSTLPSYSLLPQHIITTPLLRLPVQKGLTIIALLRFPDNCGDDKMCASTSKILDPSKTYTAKGVLSLNGFRLIAKIPYSLRLGNDVSTFNNTLQFTIGNKSRLNILASFRIPQSNMLFDGLIHIKKKGDMTLIMKNRESVWYAPFHFQTLSFKDIRLKETYKANFDLKVLKLTGKISLGSANVTKKIESDLKLNYNPEYPFQSTFYANFSDISLSNLLETFSINISLPKVLRESEFPYGLMLSYSGNGLSNSSYELHGEIRIFGRLLNCQIMILGTNRMEIITENSPAPVIFAKGQIIIQQDSKSKLRGPSIIADINPTGANVIAKGYAKVLGIESDVDIALHNKDIKFSVTGKLMEFKQTKLTAYTTGSLDSFQVYGCLDDIALQVQLLLIEIIARSANQSMINMEKAEENYLNSDQLYGKSEEVETDIRMQRDRERDIYEKQLLEYGRYEVRVNDTCVAPKCGMKCFGCPRLNKCCRLDIFGQCIVCSSWKNCCWKNINPLCIAKYDGCHVIRTLADKDLAEKEAQILQQRIIVDNLDQQTIRAEVDKGKHKAVLEAAIDAKQVVAEDSSPGLNAHDAIKNFGTPYGWAKINSVCYDTSMEQAATGCMDFKVASQLFSTPEKNITIWSCLKEDLVTELAESLANYIFPNIIDTSNDNVNEVGTHLENSINQNNNELANQNPTNTENQSPITISDMDGSSYEINDYQQNIPQSPKVLYPTPQEPNKPQTYDLSSPLARPTPSVIINEVDNSQVNKVGENNLKPTKNMPPNQILKNGQRKVKLIDASDMQKVLSSISASKYPDEMTSGDNESLSSGDYMSSGSASGEEAGSAMSQTDKELKTIFETEILKADKKISMKAKAKGKSKSGTPPSLADHIVEEEMDDEGAPNVERDKSNKTKSTDVIGDRNFTNPRDMLPKFIIFNGVKGYPSVGKQNPFGVMHKQHPSTYKMDSHDPYYNSAFGKHHNSFHDPYYDHDKGGKSKKKQKGKEAKKEKAKKPKQRDGGDGMFHFRFKRNLDNLIEESHLHKYGKSKQLLFANPFWDVQGDHDIITTRSNIPLRPNQQKLMSKMFKKRWKIPENSIGRCHIYHQLIAICKDMADTIVMLDKSIKAARSKFHEEDKFTYLELFETEEFLVESAKKVNVSTVVMGQADKTLTVVKQGVNIWSKRCSNEFDWQNQSGVRTWLQAMDLRIQQLGGFGVYRFLENLFHAFEALFEAATYSDASSAKNALSMLQRIRNMSKIFDKVFKNKLSISDSRMFADHILSELNILRKETIFC